MNDNIKIEIITEPGRCSLDKMIYALNNDLEMLSSNADAVDCLVAAASGIFAPKLLYVNLLLNHYFNNNYLKFPKATNTVCR